MDLHRFSTHRMLYWTDDTSSTWFVCADPFLLPPMQVDKGAIKFILSGANVMCPGLTSPGARMTDVQAETVVVSF